MAIPVITMRRSWRSRWADLSDHDRPKSALSISSVLTAVDLLRRGQLNDEGTHV
jgi:hypothetical protein